jgi:hypothetical protein
MSINVGRQVNLIWFSPGDNTGMPAPAVSRRPGLSRNWTPALSCAITAASNSPRVVPLIFFLGCGPVALFSGQATLDHATQPQRLGGKHVERTQNA